MRGLCIIRGGPPLLFLSCWGQVHAMGLHCCMCGLPWTVWWKWLSFFSHAWGDCGDFSSLMVRCPLMIPLTCKSVRGDAPSPDGWSCVSFCSHGGDVRKDLLSNPAWLPSGNKISRWMPILPNPKSFHTCLILFYFFLENFAIWTLNSILMRASVSFLISSCSRGVSQNSMVCLLPFFLAEFYSFSYIHRESSQKSVWISSLRGAWTVFFFWKVVALVSLFEEDSNAKNKRI